MFNFAFFLKTFELMEDSKNKLNETLNEIAQFIVYKFNTMLILYINKRIDDYDKFENFVKLVEQADERMTSPDDIEKYIQWLKKNSQIDMAEFSEKFEYEIFQIELRLIKKLSQNLNNAQKMKLIKFLKEQNKYEKTALKEIQAILNH